MSKTIPERKDINPDDTWKLSIFFENDKAWEILFSKTENRVSGYDTYKGKLGESTQLLKTAIEFHLSISRDIENLYVYAHLKNDEDKTQQHYEGCYQSARNLYTRISQAGSFFVPEIQRVEDETMAGFLSDPHLSDYKLFLERILRNKPHTRSDEVEQVLAMSMETMGAPSQIFSQLNNADMTFGVIENDKGKTVELSHGNFNTFLTSQNRSVRKNAFDTYYKAYDSLKHTIAASLSTSVKKDVFSANVRAFKSCRQSALFPDDVPLSVYDNLIKSVKENLNPLFDYFEFRKNALKLDSLHFYDTYVPLVDSISFHMPYEEAVSTCINALAPLGKEYTTILEDGLLNGWVDRYENKGKRSGAYSSGSYDSLPYILMNYEEGNINSLYTLIHEAGHSMHSYYSKKHQPYVYSDYTIFVAEVASTLNESLLSRYLLEKYADDKSMTAYILNREIDNIRATLYRQTMFAEFEKNIHGLAEENKPLTLDVLTGEYEILLKQYFGDILVIDAVLKLECLRIPHFYSPFYVYKYATGISAAISLTEKILKEGESAVTDYLSFLKLGGSLFPINQLIKAGVDMSSPLPVKNALFHFENCVHRLKQLL